MSSFSTTTVDLAGASRNTWYLSQAYGQSLAAGTYTLRIQLPEHMNVDNIRVCASRDSDGDGKADRLDIDSNNDSITDKCTEQYGTVTQMCQIRMPDRVKSQCLQALHLEAVMHQIT